MRRSALSAAQTCVRGAAIPLFFISIVGPAAAADLPARTPVYAPPVTAPAAVYNWTGFYIGGNAGGIWSNTDIVTTVNSTSAPVFTGSGSRSGFTGGGQMGYNWMLGSNFVAGFEVDSQYSSLSNTVLSPGGTNQHDSVFDYFGTARLRAGVAANNWLFYGTGGFAWAHEQVSRTQLVGTLNAAAPGTVETVDNWRTGWAAGGGIEWAFAPSWTARAEYLHLDLGNTLSVFPLADRAQSANFTAEVGRFGVNYKFP